MFVEPQFFVVTIFIVGIIKSFEAASRLNLKTVLAMRRKLGKTLIKITKDIKWVKLLKYATS